ncbi:fructosamine kinase family protein [Halioxenophilus aromaticivorans]|uniref:Fructosamine kinase family protein n=1 Tax=Halioxenophilus aromaticivorans TaxID=1306992 RepID=A0AAV3U418_9ALTE
MDRPLPKQSPSTLTWQTWVTSHLGPLATSANSHNGQIATADGRQWFVKRYSGKDAGAQAQAEAMGLHCLRHTAKQLPNHELQVVQPMALGSDWLLLPWLASGHGQEDWAALGRGLARLHDKSQPYFGFEHDNFCGPTPQPNPKNRDGYTFFAVSRLQFQADINLRQQTISTQDRQQIDTLCSRLTELVPEQPPTLVHGDLWRGNVLFSSQGPTLIDPACYFGWPEAELAMTLLFGGFDAQFYHAYEEVKPLAPGWRQRAEIYNLYHLLNHVYMFGSSYYGQVKTVLNRYCD